jgi:photosystem II stability/assembly factor-like uncharacterized protein
MLGLSCRVSYLYIDFRSTVEETDLVPHTPRARPRGRLRVGRWLVPLRVLLMTPTRIALVVAVLLQAGPAVGNGAFPDSQAVLTPEDLPNWILLSTNFGEIRSDDNGRTWTWSCEQEINGMRNLYQLGPAPRHRLFARDRGGLVFTDDHGCTWTASTGALGDFVLSDAFPDPTNSERVLAVAAPRGGTGGTYRVLESLDGGATFAKVLYVAASGDTVSGVEISRADPDVVYLVVLKGASLAPTLAISTDRGVGWQEHELGGALGTGSTVLLIAVDRNDPSRVFLQVNSPSNVLAVVDGGGVLVTTALSLEGGFMSGFLQTEEGVILVSGLVGAGPVLYRSGDGARTFTAIPSPPALWGLSERAGTIFGAARTGEPFAIGTSIDGGSSWQPLMRYADVHAIAACAQVACEDTCLLQASRKLWSEYTCLPAVSRDGSTDDVGSGGDRDKPSGCGCALSGRPSPLILALLVPIVIRGLRRRGNRRS